MKNVLILFAVIMSFNMKAELEMPKIFSNNMVLQRDIPIPVWGKANPGQTVTVEFKGHKKSVAAGADGKWSLRIGPFSSSVKAEKLTVTQGKKQKEFNNVIVGEVWLCSGQSNMQSSFASLKITDKIKGVDYPLIRLSSGGKWTTCTTRNLTSFSSAAYYFGLKLFQELKVPIGLIDISRGCSSIEAWMPPESIASNDYLIDINGCKLIEEMKKFQDFHSNYKRKSQKEKERVFLEHCKSKYVYARNFLQNGKLKQGKGKKILSHMSVVKPAFLFNKLIAPEVPYAVRGVIWYQGETNVDDRQYALKQKLLVEGWRKLWGQKDFPFYIVQIAPFKGYPDLPAFWLQQYEAVAKTKKTGLVSTVDIGDINECHPQNKWDVGKRLALLALRDTYAMKKIIASGPTLKSAETSDNSIYVHFNNCGSGLVTKDGGPPDCFEVAGPDKKFYKAKARISGNSVEVKSTKVKDPVYVRYAWKHSAVPNLRNKEALPALPFNTAVPFFQ